MELGGFMDDGLFEETRDRHQRSLPVSYNAKICEPQVGRALPIQGLRLCMIVYLKIIFHECVYPVLVIYLDYSFVQDSFGPGTGCNHKYTTYLGIIF